MICPLYQQKRDSSHFVFAIAVFWYFFCLKSCHSFVLPLKPVILRGNRIQNSTNDKKKNEHHLDSINSGSCLFYRRTDDVSFTKIEEENIMEELPKAPFPDGPCGGSIVTLDIPMDHKKVSSLFTNDFFFPSRSIQVWLPPEYHYHTNMRFPVLYCHDGQNVMQDSMSWTGSSWRLMGAITRLVERKLIETPPIVVMIPSTDGDLLFLRRRHLEYGDMGQQLSQVHADHVALSIKPAVDKQFRTHSSAKHTFAMGTSLGGQASLHLLLRHGNLFGGAACLSPAFTAGTLASVVATTLSLNEKKLYMDNGGDDGDRKVPFFDVWDHVTQNHWWNPGYWWLDTQLQPGIDAMRMALDLKKLPYHYKKFPGARHNERAWAQRIHEPLLYLYGPDKNKDTIHNLLHNNNNNK